MKYEQVTMQDILNPDMVIEVPSIKKELPDYARVEIDSNGNRYTVDMVTVSAPISTHNLQKLTDYLKSEDGKLYNLNYFHSSKAQQYRNLFTIQFPKGGTIKIAAHMNEVKYENKDNGYIEYNPNKFAGNRLAWGVIDKIRKFYPWAELKRFDLAIDIPRHPNQLILQKDQRSYRTTRFSDLDVTEYLGKRSHVGSVKLYNKQIESNLSRPLTRLEITVDEDNIRLPHIYDISKLPVDTETEVLIRALAMSGNPTVLLSDLTPYKRKVVTGFLKEHEIIFDEDCIAKMVDCAKTHATGEATRKHERMVADNDAV